MSSAYAAASYQVIAAGLDNPRGLAYDAIGQLYGAEAGRGGSGRCAEGPEGTSCFQGVAAMYRVEQIESVKTVILVVDMENDFRSPGAPFETSAGRRMLLVWRSAML